jgi:hypothetical protein
MTGPLPDLAPSALEAEDVPSPAGASETPPEGEHVRMHEALEGGHTTYPPELEQQHIRARAERIDEAASDRAQSPPPGLERERLILDELEAWLRALGR